MWGGLATRGGVRIFNVLNKEIIKVMNKEFEMLVDKVAKRLAEGKKPHKATLNKMYGYPGVKAEYRLKRMDERYAYFRKQYLDRQDELAQMFANAMSGKRSYETVGEETTHNIKFVK